MQEEQILNGEEFDQLMPTLIQAFKTIYSGKSTDISYNDTYRSVYRLCKKGMHTKIVDELVSVSREHYKNIFQSMQVDQNIISSFQQAIKRCNEEMSRVMEILLYVETNYYHQCKKQYQSLRDMLNSLLYQQLSKNQEILKKISAKIAQSRITGKSQEMGKTIQMINGFGKYEFFDKFFAKIYESLLVQHFTEVSKQNFANLSQKQYFLASQKLLQDEREWVKKYFLNKSTKNEINRLMASFYTAIVTNFRQRIYQKNPEDLFTTNTLYYLELLRQKGDNSEIDSHNDWFMEQIKKKLQSLDKINNSQFLQKFIDNYIEVSSSLSEIKQFSIRYKAIFFFEDWINDEKINLPKRLNFYIQECIHKKENPEKCLKNFKQLFKFLKEKDLFEKLFRADYAMRLIYSSYDPTIQNMITKEMDNQCGTQWLQKINKVKIVPSFFSHDPKKIVNVLCFEDVIWPLGKGKIIAELPKKLVDLGNKFITQRTQQMKKIKIQFHHIHGTSQMVIKFKSCSQKIKADTCILSLLLHLQQLGNKATVKKLISRSHYTAQQLKSPILQLKQQKILEVEGDITVSTDCTIALAEDFVQKQNKQNTIDLTKKYIEQLITFSADNQQVLNSDRKTMVSALIIKAMKSNKICKAQDLLNNVKPMIEIRGFKFDDKFVSNAIKDLIDRDFIRELENGSYQYIPV